MKRFGAAVALALCLAACHGASPEKSEAAAVSRAVNSLREADNAKKREFLGALRGTPCSSADICAVRSACLAAYELHVNVMDRVREAAKGSNAQGADAAAVEQMQRDLKRSLDLGATCTDAQGEMIRRYKL